MDKLIELAKKASKLNVHELLNHVLSDPQIQEEIIDLNKINQLFEKGLNADGEIIGLYSATTERLSGGEKRAGTPYTLKDTGQFYESFKIYLEDTEFFIAANPIKGNDNLFEKYGENILGLTIESKEILKPSILENISLEIKAYLQNT